MATIGNQVQFNMYLSSSDPVVMLEEWEEKAREKLEAGPFYYVAGGAGTETMRANRSAFEDVQIVPRMLRNVADRDLSVRLFAETLASPLLLAPVGVQSIVHKQGELASARAAARHGVPYIASTASSFTIEDIATELGETPKWFQLYWGKDPEITKSMLQRAQQAGYTALVVTLDTPILGWREQDLKNRYLPFIDGIGMANFLSDPAFRADLKQTPEADMEAAIQHFFRVFSNPSLTWQDLEFLKQHWQGPILLKGVLHPEDAELALHHGADGLIVSNHGGRQVGGSIGALEALPGICEAVQGKVPVLMDSGIRTGSDVLKAMALGAKAVLIGRPFMYGLAVDGENGVYQVLQNLLADLDLTMALAGISNIKDVDRSLLRK